MNKLKELIKEVERMVFFIKSNSVSDKLYIFPEYCKVECNLYVNILKGIKQTVEAVNVNKYSKTPLRYTFLIDIKDWQKLKELLGVK